jgi:DNA gyrase subunit B
VGVRGLHHLVYEVVDNSIDEAMGGYCDTIIVISMKMVLTVEDNGRGIPVEFIKKEGVSALEVVMTKIGAGGKFDKDSYKVSGGLHGVGFQWLMHYQITLRLLFIVVMVKCINKNTKRKNAIPVKQIGETTKRNNSYFYPDETIFTQTTDFSYDTLSARMRELSYLNKGITITFTDKRELDKDGNFVCEIFILMKD